jgi:hypothetical protein
MEEDMKYNLAKYAKAFELLGTNYQFQVKDAQRQVLVFVALNLDFMNNDVQAAVLNLFGAGALDRNTSDIINTLTEIKKIGFHSDSKTVLEPESDDNGDVVYRERPVEEGE